MFLVARALDLVLVYRHCIVILIRCSRQGPGLPFLTLLASIGELLATSLRLALTHRIMLLLTSIRGLRTTVRLCWPAKPARLQRSLVCSQPTNAFPPSFAAYTASAIAFSTSSTDKQLSRPSNAHITSQGDQSEHQTSK
jgi:hypothetical protein